LAILQGDVCRRRPVDEPDRSGTGAELARCLVGRGEDVGMVRQRQVAVAVHLDELAARPLQAEPRAAVA
jgi:hypothetical protein